MKILRDIPNVCNQRAKLLRGGDIALEENDPAGPDFRQQAAQFRAALLSLKTDTQQSTHFVDSLFHLMR